jgi:hypothetical protein
MTTTLSRLVLGCLLLVACSDPTSEHEQPDASPSSVDAPAQQNVTCTGESFQLQGAMSLVTASASTVTVGGHVSGVAGSAGPNRVYALNAHLAASGTIDAVGTYDVSLLKLQYLDQPFDGCSSGPCTGFFAMAGEYNVIETQPMYRASFTLRDLHERENSSSPPGAAIAGEITGCVSAPN